MRAGRRREENPAAEEQTRGCQNIRAGHPLFTRRCARLRWEYAIESVTVAEKWGSKRQAQELEQFQARLNQYGANGWEMIGFETVPLTGTFSGNIKGYIYLCFFKRQQA